MLESLIWLLVGWLVVALSCWLDGRFVALLGPSMASSVQLPGRMQAGSCILFGVVGWLGRWCPCVLFVGGFCVCLCDWCVG